MLIAKFVVYGVVRGEMQARLPAADLVAETSIAEASSGNSALWVQPRTVF